MKECILKINSGQYDEELGAVEHALGSDCFVICKEKCLTGKSPTESRLNKKIKKEQKKLALDQKLQLEGATAIKKEEIITAEEIEEELARKEEQMGELQEMKNKVPTFAYFDLEEVKQLVPRVDIIWCKDPSKLMEDIATYAAMLSKNGKLFLVVCCFKMSLHFLYRCNLHDICGLPNHC